MNPFPLTSMVRNSIVALLIFTPLLGCQPKPSAEQQLLDSTANQVILPALQQFQQQADDLVQSNQLFCQQSDTHQLENSRQHWRQTMESWEAVKIISFGPIQVDNMSWKIQFWPDKHNLIRRKVEELLNSSDPLTVERIEAASVVTQGLSALEFLLFDPKEGQLLNYQDDTKAERRCQLLIAISQHTQKVANKLYSEWDTKGGNYLTTLTQTGPNNSEFTDPNTAISALVDSLVVSIEASKRNQLDQPLGYGTKGNFPRPYLSEAWRSHHSLQALKAYLHAAENLYRGADGYGMDDYLINRGEAAVAAKIDQQFIQLNQLLSNAPAIFEGVSNSDDRQALEQLHQVLEVLLKTLKTDLPTAMGVQLGFNANDGD